MTKIHRYLLLTTTFVLIASLAACGRPSVRSNKVTPTAPATSSNPAKAEKENKDADAAEAVSAEAADAAKELGADAPVASSPNEELTEAKKAARMSALNEVAKLFAEDGKPVADGAVAPAAAASAAVPVVADAPKADGAVTATAPAADAAAGDAAKAAPKVDDAAATAALSIMTVPEPSQIAQVQFETATKRIFIMGLIEPSMRLNNAIALQRIELERLKKKMDAKQELTKEETAWFSKIRMDYGLLDSKNTIEETLERVDTVALSFLAAPIAVKTGWGTLGGVPKDLLSKRMEELNVSTGDSKTRFRSTRLALKTAAKTEGTFEGVELMKAFLGSADESVVANKVLIEATKEILQLLGEPEAKQEIERVRSELVRENTPAQLRN